jgi:predicted DNA-binding ribbon-helix-helix protein
MPGKRIQLDDETWSELRLMALDRTMTFQELADEAFADLLKKHGRPVDLRAALRKSAGASADVVPFRGKTKAKPGSKSKT